MEDDLEPLGASARPPPAPGDMVEIILPSGAPFPVYPQEATYVTDRAERYLTENRFTNVSDLQDLDRVLIMELLCIRWGIWISQGHDYGTGDVDVDVLQKSLKAHSVELRSLKSQVGIDKKTRDRAKGIDSPAQFISDLLARAKEFGVTREAQLGKALELFQQMKAMVTLHLNADEQERQELHIQLEDLLAWIVNVLIPEYDEIDEYFRTHSQRFWVRQL